MTATAWLLLIVVLFLDTASHLLLKSASLRASAQSGPEFVLALLRQPMLWLTLAAFVALFIAWTGFISLVPLSQGVMAGSITIVGVMIGGRLVFGEQLTAARLTAIGLISAGVLLVGWGA